jgi:hypothetical protein
MAGQAKTPTIITMSVEWWREALVEVGSGRVGEFLQRTEE